MACALSRLSAISLQREPINLVEKRELFPALFSKEFYSFCSKSENGHERQLVTIIPDKAIFMFE